jgi:hypothetical protein
MELVYRKASVLVSFYSLGNCILQFILKLWYLNKQVSSFLDVIWNQGLKYGMIFQLYEMCQFPQIQ